MEVNHGKDQAYRNCYTGPGDDCTILHRRPRLERGRKVNSPTAEGYYLSDGHVNLAILKFKYDDPAATEGMLRYTGLHHFGVEIDNMDEARAQIEKAGAVHRPYPGTEEMAKRGNVEVKFTGPDGVTIDLSEHGWLGTK